MYSKSLSKIFIIVGVLLCAFSTFSRAADSVDLSKLDLSKMNQEWGAPQVNLSVDRNPLTIAGKQYANGVGTHAASELYIDLAGAGERFTAAVGVDDETGIEGQVLIFQVLADGKSAWTSGPVKPGDPAKSVDIDLKDVKLLGLLVTSAADNNRYCHANWVDAKITYNGRAPVTTTLPSRPAEILTPPAPKTPRVNGPTVFGVRPGNPFIYTIPATGERPMKFAVDELPAGLTLDENTGRITGTISGRGEYYTTLRATNSLGTSEKKFRIVVGETIALTPPMGWNSWNCWGDKVDQVKVLGSARAMVNSGLINHGWTYINIDDAWQGKRGGELNAIQPNEKFPDMKGLCDELHAMGLKVGIYSTPWVESYAGYIGGSAENPKGTWQKDTTRAPKNRRVLPFHLGKHSFAKADAQQWATWGIDYLKYDWAPIDVPKAREMYDALLATRRDIVYSLSNNATDTVLGIADELSKFVTAWRTTNDIVDTWRVTVQIGFNQDMWAPHQSPGHYPDPDMLVVGHVGWGRPHPTRLTPDEQYSHISLWSLLGSPLLIGCDMEKLDAFTLGLLTNDEVIAVNQDALCKPATHLRPGSALHVYTKELEDGSLAVGLFNAGPTEATVIAKWADMKITGQRRVRDLWRQSDIIGVFDTEFVATLPPHGVKLVRLIRAE